MIDYRILPEQKLIVICSWGKTSVEAVEKFRSKILSDPNFSNHYDAVVDSTDLRQEYSSEEIERISRPRIDTSIFTGKIAAISPADITFGVSRMYEMVSEIQAPRNFYVFRDIPSALKWLERETFDIESVFKEIKASTT